MENASPFLPQDYQSLRFLWWNVESMAHYDPDRRLAPRWSQSNDAYVEKANRIGSVLSACAQATGGLEIIALAEITRKAAEDLRARLFPNYSLESLDLFDDNPDFHIAILFPGSISFEVELPLITQNTPRGTRPMAVLNFRYADEQIQFIFAHWAAPFDSEGERTQEKMAEHLNTYLFDFLNPQEPTLNRHAVVIGDFNCEPFQTVATHFDAARNRTRAMSSHYTDRDVKRVRLYNCAWRLLGERLPHGPSVGISAAGSYYWADKRSWLTVDQVLISGSLLTSRVPYFDEASLALFDRGGLLDEKGFPRKFDWNGESASGVSDHLPITGRVVLQEKS